jgi:hypothetical protein
VTQVTGGKKSLQRDEMGAQMSRRFGYKRNYVRANSDHFPRPVM